MGPEERTEALAWLKENAYFYPAFAPENVDVKNLVALWAGRFKRREVLDNPRHEIWSLAREVARETAPLVPWTLAEEAAIVESSGLESLILHGRATDDERARYAALRAGATASPAAFEKTASERRLRAAMERLGE